MLLPLPLQQGHEKKNSEGANSADINYNLSLLPLADPDKILLTQLALCTWVAPKTSPLPSGFFIKL